MDWTQLHCHTEMSLLDGIIRRKELISKAKELGLSAVCISEHGNMINCVDFYIQAKKEDIKPIIGIEMYMVPGIDGVKYNDHLLLISYNNIGYHNLLKLSTMSFGDSYSGGRGRITYNQLSENSEGIIISSACLAGRINRFIADDMIDEAATWAKSMQERYGENFFIELIDNGWSLQKFHNPILIEIARTMGIPLIATNDVHYLTREHAYTQDVALAVQTDQTINSKERRMSIYENGNAVTDGYLKTYEEMLELGFPQDAYDNVAYVIEMIEEYDIKYRDVMMPRYTSIPQQYTSSEFVRTICEGNKGRIPQGLEQEYWDRFNMEMKVIDKLGFMDYFLIIWDIIDYCKSRNILTGPGRGSASGSIVVYLLGITEIDPIKYGLYFERFLNPDRVSPPDIDFDVEQQYRQEVVQYIKTKYGDNNAVQIGTITRMAVKDTIKRVGKVLGIDFVTVQRISKEVNLDEGTKNHNMAELLEKQPSLKNQMDALDNRWWSYCNDLCNLPVNIGVHAAGIIISNEGLDDIPLCKAGAKGGVKGNIVTQLDMQILEKMGLVKFDLLGLKSLDVIHDTIDVINGIKLTYGNIRDIYNEEIFPLNDDDSYTLIKNGNTTGVFQLENEGFKSLCRSLQPENFDQVAALNALYRPGPMGSGVLDSFVERRHGRESILYPFEGIKEITNDTYGLTLYQEQLMAMAVEVVGYSLPEADNLRKIIGKKLVEKIDEEGDKFIPRGIQYGKYTEEEVRTAWEIIVPSGRYSWSKSHAFAYAHITYIMAYLKVHYPAEFYTASLNLSLGDSERISTLIRDAKEFGISILPPNVNLSVDKFTAVDNGIIYGLQSIKGIGEQASNAIIVERNRNGLFEGILDFMRRVPANCVNSGHIGALIGAGAFSGVDEVPYSRAAMHKALDDLASNRKAKKYARSTIDKRLQQSREAGAFDDVKECIAAVERGPDKNNKYTLYLPISASTIEEIPEYDNMQMYKMEMDLLGVCLSVKIDDMFEIYRRWFSGVEFIKSSKVDKLSYGWKFALNGVVTRSHKIVTKNGKPMGFISLSDDTGTSDITVFPEVWAETIIKDSESYIVLCRMDMSKNRDSNQIIADKVIDISVGVRTSMVTLDKIDSSRLSRLKLLGEFNGFHYDASSSMIVPKQGNITFMVTKHVGCMFDILIGEDKWKITL
jgi:DNA polymerase III subunit alpha